MRIKEIIVVEGKEDTRRLKEVFPEIETIETRGSAINQRTIDLIRKAQETRGVIIFTDPDYQGQKIRSIINEKVPGCKNAYINKAKAIDIRKHKVGVEHCSTEDITESLASITEMCEEISDVNFNDLYDLKIIGSPGSQELREYISEQLHIGYNNAKQFLNKIKMFNIPKNKIISLIDEYNQKKMVNKDE